MALQVTPLAPCIGAEVSGADLARLDGDQFEQIQHALWAHQVLFVRDQPKLEPETQINFAKRFGPLHFHPAAPHLDGYPELFVIYADEHSKVANGNGWHTDVSCDEEPPLATMLQLHTVPETGGDTLFSSMYAAFETLSEPMQNFLCELTALHDSEHIYRGRYADRGVDDAGKRYPSAVHPVVRTHPETGRQALYVNPSFTTRIQNLSSDESRALLDLLFRHQQRAEFQVRFKWQENDIALWDNRCTQHLALWDYWPQTRSGHRVTIKGERPVYRAAPNEHRRMKLSRSSI